MNPDPGGDEEPGGLVPPYEGRSTGRGGSASSEALGDTVASQLAGSDPGQTGQTASPADESPVQADQLTSDVPESPLGVGESVSRRGEDISGQEGKEPGRQDAGTRDASGRPAGTSDQRDATSVES